MTINLFFLQYLKLLFYTSTHPGSRPLRPVQMSNVFTPLAVRTPFSCLYPSVTIQRHLFPPSSGSLSLKCCFYDRSWQGVSFERVPDPFSVCLCVSLSLLLWLFLLQSFPALLHLFYADFIHSFACEHFVSLL